MCQTRDHNLFIGLLTNRNGFNWICGDLLSETALIKWNAWEVKEDLFNPCRFSSDQTVAGSLTADGVCAQLSSPRVCGASDEFTGHNITY